ncbi:MAG: acyl-CoA synthetase [Verrucomicrobia bacterium]|jgi:acyl-coenzyme A synthetase/AMP-(fatty) acid ligase|nr:acyl-CoA synthetase [Verrucomicrobiota bacterium]
MPDFIPLSELMLKPWDECPVVAGLFGEVSGKQFRDDVETLVSQLKSRPEKRWTLCLHDSYSFAVAFMAAACAGKELVLPGNLQPNALTVIADGYDAIINDEFIANVDEASLPRFAFHALELDAISITLYTSGSSGVPKAIQKSLTRLADEIQTLEKLWGGMLEGSLVAGTVSHQHIYGLLFRILWPLCAGRPFERGMRDHPEQIADHGGSNVTLISSPALLKRIKTISKTTHYRAVFSSGGVLPFSASVLSQNMLDIMPIEVFGSTETGGIAFRSASVEKKPWKLFPPIEMKLNEDGCLCIKSPFAHPGNWHTTADRCLMLSDRTFVLQGRADRVIKVEEKRISLPEIELHLQALEWIGEAVVFPGELNNRRMLGAVITLTHAGQNKFNEMGPGRFWIMLRNELRNSVEPVGIPRRYRVVEQIPMDPQGKYSLTKMEKMFMENA